MENKTHFIVKVKMQKDPLKQKQVYILFKVQNTS